MGLVTVSLELDPQRLPETPTNLRSHFHSGAMVEAAIPELVELTCSYVVATSVAAVDSPPMRLVFVRFDASAVVNDAASVAVEVVVFGRMMMVVALSSVSPSLLLGLHLWQPGC